METLSQRIIAFNKDRLQDMVQLKYEGMAENLYRFFRGTNHIFYEDLQKSNFKLSSPLAWICGDLHLENFGSYKSDNRLVYFDLNDFDEGVLAPCHFELVRIITSIFIAFDSLNIEQTRALHMAELFIEKYARHLSMGKPAYIERQTAQGIVCEFLTAVGKRKQKDILQRRTISKKHRLEILLDDPKHFELDKQLKKQLLQHITEFLKTDTRTPYNYEAVDAVFRLAGTGSIGMKRYAILLKSSNENGEKYILLDMKQSCPAAIGQFFDFEQPAFSSDAERIVTLYNRMQNRPPALLSTTIFNDEPYVIQEMQPVKDSINFKRIKRDYRDMCRVIEDMAMLTASAQLRSTGQQGSAITDALKEFGQNDTWKQSILEYAIDYSYQVQKDYMLFLRDLKKGVFKKAESIAQ